MEIGTPLRRLEIIGNDAISILKANHSEMIGKGSKEHILSVRQEIFTSRSFKVPEDWDTTWDIKLGPIWTPAELGSTALVCWLSPEYFHELDTDATRIAQADDRSGNSMIWENTNDVNTLPTFTSVMNGFKGMAFAGGGPDWLYSLDESGDGELDPGTGDFAITMLVEFGTVTTSERHVLCSDNSRDFALAVQQDSSSGLDHYQVYFDGSSTETTVQVDQSNPVILTVGRSGGAQFLKVGTVASNDASITGAEGVDIDDSQQFFIGAREHASNDRLGISGFTGNIYEITFYNGTLSSTNIENIEGYLAHKFAQTGSLISTHTYKHNPPRAGVPA